MIAFEHDGIDDHRLNRSFASKQQVLQMKKHERDALVKFVESL